MEKGHINHKELKGFVEYHGLSNKYSVIQFNALVTITTEKNKVSNEEMEVGITFDGYNNYGTVTLLESYLDPYLYPTVFKAQWQNIKHIDKEYLYITDTHPTIGRYEVKIIPFSR